MKKKRVVGIGIVAFGVGVLLWQQSKVGRLRSSSCAEPWRSKVESQTTEYAENTEGSRADNQMVGSENVERAFQPAHGQTGMSAPRLSNAVKALVGMDGGEHDYNSLEAAIHELSKELSADDVAVLCGACKMQAVRKRA